MATLAPTHPVITAVLAYVCHALLVCSVVCLGNALSMLFTLMYLTMPVDTPPPSPSVLLMALSFLVASLVCAVWRHSLMAEQREAE